jgi:type I restriction enzyme, S subunit
LKTVAELRTSNVDKNSSEDEQPVRLCNYTDVYYSSEIRDASGFMKATATPDEIRRFRLRRGDVLITKDSETAGDIAVPAHVARDFDDVLCGYHLAILRPRRELVGKFLYYAILTNRVRDQFTLGAKGITRFGLSQSAIKNVVVPVPDVDTQTAIACFLDRETARIDTLIEKKRRLLDLLEEKRTALITRAVMRGLDPDVPVKESGVEWIGQIPEHWEVRQARYLCARSRPIIYGIVLPGPDVPDGVPLIKGGDVDRCELHPDKLSRTAFEIEARHTRSRVAAGDVVYSIRGSFGEAAIVPQGLEGANLTQDAARLSPRRSVNAEWLSAALTSAPLKAIAEAGALGATIKGVNIRDLRRLPVPTPPPEEQARVARFLRDADARFNRTDHRIRRAITLLEEYRTAVISAAVSGKIRIGESRSHDRGSTMLPSDRVHSATGLGCEISRPSFFMNHI